MNNKSTAASNGAQTLEPASIFINAQYVKDLSFENPNTPGTIDLKDEPNIEVNIDVRASKLNDGVYEVVLALSATGRSGDITLFIAELSYGSIFSLSDIDDADIHKTLLVNCPELMFPFARNIIADVTRDGGYPPVLMQPVDFMKIFATKQSESALN